MSYFRNKSDGSASRNNTSNGVKVRNANSNGTKSNIQINDIFLFGSIFIFYFRHCCNLLTNLSYRGITFHYYYLLLYIFARLELRSRLGPTVNVFPDDFLAFDFVPLLFAFLTLQKVHHNMKLCSFNVVWLCFPL